MHSAASGLRGPEMSEIAAGSILPAGGSTSTSLYLLIDFELEVHFVFRLNCAVDLGHTAK